MNYYINQATLPHSAVPNCSRRRFAGLLAASTVCAVAGSTFDAVARPADSAGWIDAHVHVWTPDLQRYPLGKNYRKADMQPASFTPEELLAHSKPAGVTRIVLIQMSYYAFDNRYMTDVIASSPGVFSGVAVVDHERPGLKERIRELADQGVRGFRIYAGQESAAKWLRNDAMELLWRLASEHNLAICPLINPADIGVVEQFVQKFPQTTVVVDHFARIGIDGVIRNSDLDALCRLAKYSRVYVKTSAYYALGKKTPPYRDLYPMIVRVRDAFGAARLMWASDCPFQVEGAHSYLASINLIREAPNSVLTEEDKTWLLRDTAAAVFFGNR